MMMKRRWIDLYNYFPAGYYADDLTNISLSFGKCGVYAHPYDFNPKFKVASALVLTDNLDSVYSPSVPRGTSNRFQLSGRQLDPPAIIIL